MRARNGTPSSSPIRTPICGSSTRSPARSIPRTWLHISDRRTLIRAAKSFEQGDASQMDQGRGANDPHRAPAPSLDET